jgi:SAM-dependent methyltransferase
MAVTGIMSWPIGCRGGTRVPDVFEWDQTLYRGTAPYYVQGRVPYPVELADALAAELGLDGTGRLLDAGCGPGALTLLLAPLFGAAVGFDPDPGMLEQARLAAERSGVANVSWQRLRAEELPAGLGEFRVVTFAQSFHWVDQNMVARAVRQMLRPDGACVLVFATTHEGVSAAGDLPQPQPPRAQIADLIAAYLGSTRRAGQGLRPESRLDDTSSSLIQAGFAGPVRLEVGGRVHERTEDQVVASVFSLSFAAPHLFGDQLGLFEAELRRLLRAVSPDGRFAERMREIGVEVWRPASATA